MSVNIKKDGELVKIANNISIVQADWNDRNNTNKNTCIKNQPDTIKTMVDLEACEDENALAGAMAVKELNDKVPTKTSQLTNDTGFKSSSDTVSNYDDIMANTVAGYVPDALAVKEGFQEINDSLGTVKTANCILYGGTLAGEFTYTQNKVYYIIAGNLLFYEIEIVIDEIITHPEGHVSIALNIPELKTRTVSSNGTAAVNVGFMKGGYKESLRRAAHGNLYDDKAKGGRISLRILRIPNEDTYLAPSLVAASFVTNSATVNNTTNTICLNDGTTSPSMCMSGVGIITS